MYIDKGDKVSIKDTERVNAVGRTGIVVGVLYRKPPSLQQDEQGEYIEVWYEVKMDDTGKIEEFPKGELRKIGN